MKPLFIALFASAALLGACNAQQPPVAAKATPQTQVAEVPAGKRARAWRSPALQRFFAATVVNMVGSGMLFAFVFITSENLKTLPVGLQLLVFGDIYPWGQLMSASLLMAIPVVIVYIYAQRYLVEGLTAGSVKG